MPRGGQPHTAPIYRSPWLPVVSARFSSANLPCRAGQHLAAV